MRTQTHIDGPDKLQKLAKDPFMNAIGYGLIGVRINSWSPGNNDARLADPSLLDEATRLELMFEAVSTGIARGYWLIQPAALRPGFMHMQDAALDPSDSQ